MDNREKILGIIRSRGPVIPVTIGKELGLNMIFASAHLSEMVANGQLALTQSLRIGTSPLYYIKGQEYRLQEHVKYLNEKDRKAFEILKENKILRDKEQIPIMQVSLRALKDFAVPLQVTHDNSDKEIFWRFYLLGTDDAKRMIESKIRGEKAEAKQEAEARAEVKPEAKTEAKHDNKAHIKPDPEIKLKAEHKPELKKEPEPKKAEPKAEIKRPETKVEAKQIRKEEQKVTRNEPDAEQVETQFVDTTISDPFAKEVKNYFDKNKIIVMHSTIIKKNSDVDYLIQIPSVMGYLPYFCKAKKKKLVNEGDVSSAYLQGQLKKLPVILITPGELNKKAKDMVEKDLKGIIIKKI